MPGNWDTFQNINGITGRVEWPQGPMELDPGVEPKWIEAWVLQSSTTTAPAEEVLGTGASQSTRQKEGWQPGFTR